jgi:hypothetical protein
MERDVHTIEQYCKLEQISRSKYYEEQKAGCGVEYFRRGAKVLISEAARRRHRERLEQEARTQRATAAGAAKPELTTA